MKKILQVLASLSSLLFFAAIANALYKATGKRFYEQPFAKQIEMSPTRM